MGKFDKYKIDLKGMQADLVTYEFDLDSLYFSHIDAPEVQKGNVHVELTVKQTTQAYEFTFHTDGVVWVPCDRCLDEMDIAVSSTEQLMVKLGQEYAEEGDNLVIIPEDEGAINVAWFIYEFIALSIPMKHIHVPGKCNKTMTSKLSKHLRNSGNDEEDDELDYEATADFVVTEEEIEPVIDPRWNELKKILDNN